MKFLILFLVGLLIAADLQAQHLDLKPGEEFNIETQSVATSVTTKHLVGNDNFLYQFKVLSCNADSSSVECRLLKANIWKENALYRLNTDSIRKTELNYSGLLTQLILLQGPVILVLNSQGKVKHINGIDTLISKVTQHWHLLEDLRQYQKSNIDAFLTMQSSTFFLNLPPEKLNYQSTWTEGETKYNVIAIRGALLDITAAKANTKFQGKYVLNSVNGLVEQSQLSFNLNIDGNSQDFNNTQHLYYGKKEVPLTDTAWLNMAVPLSYWSNMFENKSGEIDSAILYSYIQKYRQLYQTDRFYVVSTLSKANSLQTDGGFHAYRDLLAKAPNSFLAGQSSHLFNKTQWASEVNADTAYNVISYFHKVDGFAGWLQESFAQAFLNEDNVVATQLIEKLNADKKLNLKADIYPMYLWVKANKQPQIQSS